MSQADQPKSTLEILQENRDLFETITDEAIDPTIAEKYGDRPLRLLREHEQNGGA